MPIRDRSTLLHRGRMISAVIAGAVIVPVATAAPAAAHGIGGYEATNLAAHIVAVQPDSFGFEVRIVEVTGQVELSLDGATEVVVLGYEGEPYLRVTPSGVERNRRSPATYLNRSARPTEPAPATADPDASPEWELITRDTVARWHDHRAHWMGTGAPPHSDDGKEPGDLVASFSIDVTVDGRAVAIHGELRWLPAAPWWPWILGAVVLFGVIAIASRSAFRPVAGGVLALLTAAEVAHVVGLWAANPGSLVGRIGANAFSLIVIALCSRAAVRVVRKSTYGAAPSVLFAGLAAATVGGIGDFTNLTRSQLPTALDAGIARLLVTCALGGGLGLILAASRHLRPPGATATTGSAQPAGG